MLFGDITAQLQLPGVLLNNHSRTIWGRKTSPDCCIINFYWHLLVKSSHDSIKSYRMGVSSLEKNPKIILKYQVAYLERQSKPSFNRCCMFANTLDSNRDQYCLEKYRGQPLCIQENSEELDCRRIFRNTIANLFHLHFLFLYMYKI